MQKLKNLQLEKKIYIKTTKYEKCPKLSMDSKVTPVDGTTTSPRDFTGSQLFKSNKSNTASP